MTADLHEKKLIAVVGAGPAGIYASRLLAAEGAYAVLINRDIKPGGLAEYGIYHDKYKMKEGLRKQFRQILEDPSIGYYGNLVVGQDSGLSLEDLKGMGFQAILVTVGAQGTKWLGLPGEDLTGVYHAKDIVYHYNKLPPYSIQEFATGRSVALIGVGNVMMDIAHWLIREIKVDKVVAVARRGPAEVKFSKKEMENLALNLDLKHLNREMERVRPIMEAVGQDVLAAKDFILAGLPKAKEPVSDTLFWFDFLASPTRILGDDKGRVCGLEIEDTTLLPKNGDTKARGLGTYRILDVDTVVFCIGDRVDDRFGLPIQWNEFVKHPNPKYPINGLSYESYDPENEQAIEGVFVAGWSREASSGLVGVARKDGENGARAVLEYLENQPSLKDGSEVLDRFTQVLKKLGTTVVFKEDVWKLMEIEQAEASRLDLPDYKMKTNQEMLAAMDLG